MKVNIKSNNGFILLEVLLVLFAIALLLTITAPSFISLSADFDVDVMTKEFISNYYWARQQAIKKERWVEIIIVPDQHFYYMKNSYGTLKKVTYSDQIRITDNLSSHRIRFGGNGRLSYRGGTIKIENEQAVKKLTIQMQTGQIDLE